MRSALTPQRHILYSPSPWTYPYAPRYLGSTTCNNLGGVPGYSFCDKPPPYAIPYDKYITKLTAQVQLLFDQGTVVNVLVMPNNTGLCNEAAPQFWAGQPLQTKYCNNSVMNTDINTIVPCPTCNFCAEFDDQSSHDPGVVCVLRAPPFALTFTRQLPARVQVRGANNAADNTAH